MPRGNLPLEGARVPIEKIEVLPTVALRCPENLFAIVQVHSIVLAVVELAARERLVVDESLTRLFDERARLAARRIHFNHAVNLVTALVVLECEAT